MSKYSFITLDPGHFHAALVQKEMYSNVSPRAAVYAPLSPDLTAHLNRIAQFNLRAEDPTAWEIDVHCSPNYLDEMIRDKPGNVVVLAGRNRQKIDLIQASVDAGLHVLADKPWIIDSADMGKLAATLEKAERTGLTAYDIMTERFEITSILQRELVNDAEVFGEIQPGTWDEPGVYMESVHHIMKLVAGVPLQRPPWFFDIVEQGEGLSDVGPHLVDLAQWTLFPDQAIDHSADVSIVAAKRWPTVMSVDDYARVTGDSQLPAYLSDGNYYCNNQVTYALKGVHVKLDVLWSYQAPEGTGDTHFAGYHGTQSSIEVRQGADENYRPEVYVVPRHESVESALKARVAALQATYPGVALEGVEGAIRVTVPDEYRIGHEAHFAQVARRFFTYVEGEARMPDWETPNMLAKYLVTTRGVEMSQ